MTTTLGEWDTGHAYKLRCHDNNQANWHAMVTVVTDLGMAFEIDGLVQERCNSSALVMELRLSCTKPSKWCIALKIHTIQEFNNINKHQPSWCWNRICTYIHIYIQIYIQHGAVIMQLMFSKIFTKDTPWLIRKGEIWAVYCGSSIGMIFCLSSCNYLCHILLYWTAL